MLWFFQASLCGLHAHQEYDGISGNKCIVPHRSSLLIYACINNALLTQEVATLEVAQKASSTRYILPARPGGRLGSQLDHFWSDVKKAKLNNPAVLDYPPHITLTGFFPIKNPDTAAGEQRLIRSLQDSIQPATVVPIVIKGTFIVRTDSLDYIPFQNSPILKAITINFLDRIPVDANFLRPQPGSKRGYHITLRQNTNANTTKRVRQLENQDIHLNAAGLQAHTTWRLCIYKKTGNTLTRIYCQKIRTQ